MVISSKGRLKKTGNADLLSHAHHAQTDVTSEALRARRVLRGRALCCYFFSLNRPSAVLVGFTEAQAFCWRRSDVCTPRD